MGLFSSKTKIDVANSVSRVVEDPSIPKTAQESLIRGVMQKGTIGEHMVEGMVNGPGFKFERMFRYAEKHYTHGLPSSRTFDSTAGEPLVQAILARLAGVSVQVQYAHLAPLNNTHYGRQLLMEQYGHDPETNEITVLSAKRGVPVYLDTVQAVHTEETVAGADPTSLETWGLPQSYGYTPLRPAQGSFPIGHLRQVSPFVVDRSATEEAVLIRYTYEQDGEIQEDSFTLGLDNDTVNADFYQAYATYRKDGKRHHMYWSYRHGSGTYPELDGIFNVGDEVLGTYMPIIFFRRNGQDRTVPARRDSEEFKTSSKLMKMINMDYLDMGDGVNANPGVGDVEQAVIQFGIPINDEDPAGIEYLFEFFNFHHSSNPRAGLSDNNLFQRRSGPASALVISDADFTITLSYQSILKHKRAGDLGRVGTVEGGHRKSEGHSAYYFRKQVSAVFYEEVEVIGPQLKYDIYKGHDVVASKHEDASKLLIPLDKAVLDLVPLLRREQMYLRGMHFVFNSVQETEVEWYQQKWFSTFLMVAAVALTIASFGQAWPTIVAAAAVGAVTLAITLLTMVVSALVVDYAFKLVVREVGPEAGMVLAVIAMFAGGYKAFQAGGIQGAPWAEGLLMAANGLASGVQAENARLMDNYKGEVGEFELYKEELEDELEDTKKLLDSSSLIDPFSFVGQEPVVVLGESPTNFYNRTVHSGNIGVVAIEAIHSYVDLSLQLPDFSDTITAGDFL